MINKVYVVYRIVFSHLQFCRKSFMYTWRACVFTVATFYTSYINKFHQLVFLNARNYFTNQLKPDQPSQ